MGIYKNMDDVKPAADVDPDHTFNKLDGVRLGEFEQFIGFNLRLAQSVSFQSFARSAGRKGLKSGHFAALMLIRNNPGISQVALGKAMARDKSTVTPLIQSMEKEGLIVRERARHDRRSIALQLTPKGKQCLLELMVHAREHDRKLDIIVGDRKAEFLDALKRIADQLT
jgi:DNA-binding MarR family transcriptional regulator